MSRVAQTPQNTIAQVVSTGTSASTVFLPLEGLVDLSAERERLAQEQADLDRQIQKSESLLASAFGSKAPAAVVERERAKLAGLKESRAKVEERLNEMK